MISRIDVPLGDLCAQIIHAAGESGPVEPGTYAVALAVPNEYRLSLIEQQLTDAGIPHVAVREPDTPYCGSLMAVGIAPTRDRERLKPILGKLKLVTEVRPCPSPTTTSASSPRGTHSPSGTVPSATSAGTCT